MYENPKLKSKKRMTIFVDPKVHKALMREKVETGIPMEQAVEQLVAKRHGIKLEQSAAPAQ